MTTNNQEPEMTTNNQETNAIAEVSREPSRLVAAVQLILRYIESRKTARAIDDLRRAMARSPEFARTWQCNIAMPILDGADGKLTPGEANDIADRLMAHLFYVKIEKKERA